MTVRKQKELQKQVEKMEQQVSTFAMKLQEEKDKTQHWMKLYTQIRIERDDLAKLLQYHTDTTNNKTVEVDVNKEEKEAENTTANVEITTHESATDIIASDDEIYEDDLF